jgi:hypothetical protein
LANEQAGELIGKQFAGVVGDGRMSVRVVTLIVCAVDVIGLVITLIGYLSAQSDQATAGTDYAALVFIAGLFLLTAVPAMVLILLRRSERTALGLSLAFPAILAIIAVAAIMASA